MSAPIPLRKNLELATRVRQFAKKRVLVVGDLVADHYLYGQTDRVSREAPVLIVRYESADVKLGGGANAAANARSLGGQVSAVGALGQDEMGRALKREFKKAGIRVLAASGKDVCTETKTRILAGGLNTTRQQMLRVDRGAVGPLPSPVRMELARLVAEAARSVDAVLVSDYGAGVVSEAVWARLKKVADQVPVVIDSRYQLRGLTGATVAKPNEPELELLTGRRIRSEKELAEAGKQAVSILGCASLVVTRGRHGMAIFDSAGRMELIPVHGNQEAVDVTGAGDTVGAALTLGLGAGADVVEAARIANVAGALVVQKQGTATVSTAELLGELEK